MKVKFFFLQESSGVIKFLGVNVVSNWIKEQASKGEGSAWIVSMCEKSPDGADGYGLLFVCLVVCLSNRTLAEKMLEGNCIEGRKR